MKCTLLYKNYDLSPFPFFFIFFFLSEFFLPLLIISFLLYFLHTPITYKLPLYILHSFLQPETTYTYIVTMMDEKKIKSSSDDMNSISTGEPHYESSENVIYEMDPFIEKRLLRKLDFW